LTFQLFIVNLVHGSSVGKPAEGGGDRIGKLKHEVLREVGMLARCIQSICDIRFRELKLQRGQAIYLARVCEHPGMNLIDLSNLLKVDKTTTTKVIQKLIQAGYLEKVRDKVDRRAWLLFPTRSARTVYDSIIRQENRFIEICTGDFSPKDRETAFRIIRRMRENVEGEWTIAKAQGGAF
jgi:DNA-binding MarR family transcriptional regulator